MSDSEEKPRGWVFIERAGLIIALLGGVAALIPTLFNLLVYGVNATVPAWLALIILAITLLGFWALWSLKQRGRYDALLKEPLIIEWAWYSSISDSEKGVKVTDILRQLKSDGKVHLRGRDKEYNKLFTDPSLGEKKQLEIAYHHGGKSITIKVPEDTELTLPLMLYW